MCVCVCVCVCVCENIFVEDPKREKSKFCFQVLFVYIEPTIHTKPVNTLQANRSEFESH